MNEETIEEGSPITNLTSSKGDWKVCLLKE
jgi:hypothetical protein